METSWYHVGNKRIWFDILCCGIYLHILGFVPIYGNVLTLCCHFSLKKGLRMFVVVVFLFYVVVPVFFDQFYKRTLQSEDPSNNS